MLDPAPATALALVAAMVLTGALHEDGLADAADAIGAHVPRERRLEILRDSRVGTYGALALVFAVASRSSSSRRWTTHFLLAAIVGHVVGRWSILPQSRLCRRRAPTDGRALRAGSPDRPGQRLPAASCSPAGRPVAGRWLGVARR